MVVIDVRGLPEIQSMLRDLVANQVPFAISSALNSAAFAVQRFQKQRMPSVFDRPTPLTVGAFRVEKATKKNLTAIVYVDPRRTPVLKTHEEGGLRGDQRMERYLNSSGLLPAGWRAIPTDKMQRDRYGNPAQTEVKRIIAALSTSGGRRGAIRYVVIPPGGKSKRRPGVYCSPSKRAFVKLYRFVATARYRKRLEFAETGLVEAARILPDLMEEAITRAIRTAR